MSHPSLPSVEGLKAEAKRLRTALADAGTPITHSQSLEALARQHGFRDWNTIHAVAGNRPPGLPVTVGQAISGTYLGQAFNGTVHTLSALSDGRFRITIDLDSPIDVVEFESFSSFRRRIRATIQPNGATVERTSNGRPHMVLSL